MFEKIYGIDPIKCIKFWIFVSVNLVCFIGIVKLLKLLMYVTF